MVWIILALLVLLALPFLAEAMRAPITPALQDRAPGQLAGLSQGTTHYTWTGPEDGPVIVCVHGLSTPSYVFAATARSLSALGYRVLSYDLYGRGYSDRVRGAQTDRFFLTQLRDLLEDQDVGGEITLLGFSMGAQIASAYAAEAGRQVDALILVAPAGVAPGDGAAKSTIWRAPLIGWWLTLVFGGVALRRELVEHRSTATVIPNLEDRQATETRMRGFLPAIYSARRHLLTKSMLTDLERAAFFETPILAVWGTDDPIVPVSAIGYVAEVVPDAHHGQITGAGHNLLQTHPAQVAEHLTRFLADD